MAIVFSPLTDDELDGPFKPLPRHAFIMLHSGDGVSEIDRNLDNATCTVLRRLRYKPLKATDIAGVKDYLDKILQTIRGCGFGIAIFSEETPAPTLANIFFEVGLCHVFGKPVIIVKSKASKAPSDFVRNEYVAVDISDPATVKAEIRRAVKAMEELAEWYRTLGEEALEAEVVDYELAFERFKQSLLISNDKASRAKIGVIKSAMDKKDNPVQTMSATRVKLRTSVRSFVKALPP